MQVRGFRKYGIAVGTAECRTAGGVPRAHLGADTAHDIGAIRQHAIGSVGLLGTNRKTSGNRQNQCNRKGNESVWILSANTA